MNAREVNVFLTRAALLDPRMKRTDPAEQRDMAKAWAEVLADVPLEVALEALTEHYRGSRDTITLSDVVAFAQVEAAPYPIRSIDDELQVERRARALAAAGVTEQEFASHEHDVAWLRAHFAPKELEASDG